MLHAANQAPNLMIIDFLGHIVVKFVKELLVAEDFFVGEGGFEVRLVFHFQIRIVAVPLVLDVPFYEAF